MLNTADDEIICSNESVLLVRDMTVQGGKAPKFVNKTKELTTIRADVDGDGDLERVGIFADGLYDYFWDYNNQGLRHAQRRLPPSLPPVPGAKARRPASRSTTMARNRCELSCALQTRSQK